MKYNRAYHLTFSLLLLLSSTFTLAQSTISGNVSSAADSEPLPGVLITLKGKTQGTISDIDGNFKLKAPTDGTLVFKFIGYVTQEVALNGRTTLSVQLQEDVKQLEEVVVVGYGTEKKSDVTGAIASANVKEMQRIPLARADETLQGQVAGVRVVNNDAAPNGNVSIRVRGVTSINGGSDPLIIIDGVQGASMADVHPKDIQSIEVLKDASATAIYGSRGAAGVILITTKKGTRNTRPYFYYSGYATMHTIRKKIDLMNASEYARYMNAYRLPRLKAGETVPFTDEDIARFDAGQGTDWQDAIFRTGWTQNHHINISGGTKSTTYSISGDFLDAQGMVIHSSFRRYLVRPNLSIDLVGDKLKFTLNSLVALSKDNPTLLNSRGPQGSPVYSALIFPPTRNIYNEDGSYTQPYRGTAAVGPATEFNPVALAKEIIQENNTTRLLLAPALEYEVIKGLKAKTMVSYLQVMGEANFFANEKINQGFTFDRAASISNSRWTALQNTNTLTYEKYIAKKHYFKFTGLYEQQYIDENSNSTGARGLIKNSITYNNLGTGETPDVPYSGKTRQTLESFMGRVNYAYDGKYVLNLTGRWDAASVFSENNKRAFFPAAGLAWNLSEEAFLAEASFLDNLKLRGSYGAVGNAAIQPYQTLPQLATGVLSSYAFNGDQLTSGAGLPTQKPSTNLRWETTKQLNVGLDASLFNTRLSLTADYYQKNTTDLLLRRRLPYASGYQTQLVNAGEVENKGIELALSGSPIRTKHFEWSSTAVFSQNKNVVLSLNDGQKEIPLGNGGLPGLDNAYWLQVGQPIGLIRGIVYQGVWKSNEAALASVYNSDDSKVTPGNGKYLDYNNDGIINQKDQINIGHALPDFIYSWNNTFRYKGIELNVLLIGVQGNDIYNIARLQMEAPDGGTSKVLQRAWTLENQNTNVPSKDDQVFRNSSRWIENGSYLRIKNITLTYRLPSKLLAKAGIKSLSIYGTATNLFTFTKYSGFDPESNNASDRARDRLSTDAFAGVDLASYPSQKKYTIGLDISF